VTALTHPRRTGYVHVLRDFHFPMDGSRRTLRIFTPSAYDEQPHARFPVLYMHDGQNVFAHPESSRFDTWCANLAMQALSEDGRIEPWIIVAVDHGPDREADFSPWDYPRARVNARGSMYGHFLVHHLKPYIDRTYRTRQGSRWTATMGSSLGGLISLYLGWRYPEVFGRLGGVSPSVLWSDGKLFQHWTRHTRQWSRIYLDAGHPEHVTDAGVSLDYARGARDFFEHLRRLGYADHELRLVLEPGGQHTERDWQRRLPSAMEWLLR